LCDDGQVFVNGEVARAGSRLRGGDRVEVRLSPPSPARAQPQTLPLQVLFEDAHLIVVDKPSGLVVHPAVGHPDGTLVNALLAHCRDLSGIGGELRPGIVHRLDKDTSGVLVATKSDAAHQQLTAVFKAKALTREYLAVVVPPPTRASGRFDTLYGRHPVHRQRFSSRVARGKRAVTQYRIEERFGNYGALVRCRLETGRTHQIRVHFADAGFPVFADPVYGPRLRDAELAAWASDLGRQALHAAVLAFAHPITGRALRFETSPPADFVGLLERLRARTR
jgi:23S rRNA pseudouridine1911/1915/1917 synthase